MPSFHYDMERKHHRRSLSEDERSCCTWPKIIASLAILIVTCIIFVKFTPIDNVLDKVLPDFNSTNDNTDDGFIDDNDLKDNDSDNENAELLPTSAPTMPPFTFMQCTGYEDTFDNDEVVSTSNKCCNGLDSICELPVNDIMFATVHNAMSTFQDGFIFGANHRYSLEGALDAGYRGLHFIVCNCGGPNGGGSSSASFTSSTSNNYVFCNDNSVGEADCNLGSRDIHQTMTNVNTFLNHHPSETLFINFQIEPNVDLDVLQSILDEVEPTTATAGASNMNGFTDKLYVHNVDRTEAKSNVDNTGEWPTLGKLVEENKRVLLFHYNGPTCNIEENITCPDGFHYYYDYAMETSSTFDSVDQVLGIEASCNVTKLESKKKFFGITSYVSPPSQVDSATINSYHFARKRNDDCSDQLQQQNDVDMNVNFVYADFWFEGDLPRVVQENNAALAYDVRKNKRRLRKKSL